MSPAPGCTDGVKGCCDDICNDDCCCYAGWSSGAELVYLTLGGLPGAYSDFDYEAGYRFWVGYQRGDGLGLRFRYFDYDNTSGGLITRFDMTATDVEIFDQFDLGQNWELILGGGVRYLDKQEYSGPSEFSITGTGPVATAELYRHISDRAALYTIARQSIVFGPGAVASQPIDNATLAVTELQLGGQVHRDWNGGLLFARTGVEAQFLTGSIQSQADTTLIGAVLSLGFMR